MEFYLSTPGTAGLRARSLPAAAAADMALPAAPSAQGAPSPAD